MNILPENHETLRKEARPNGNLPQYNDLNDLNGTLSVVSDEDNTQYKSSNNFEHKTYRRKAKHERTLSSFVVAIEETKHGLKESPRANNNENSTINEDDESSDHDVNQTFRKLTYEDDKDSVKLRPTRRSRAQRQYVQHGDENIMFVYEPKESKSTNYYKQFGDKNIMVHLNVNFNSNLCQLVGENDECIPLDTEGEVWLEIKRRSRVRAERNDVSMPPNSHNNVRGERNEVSMPLNSHSKVHGERSPDTDRQVNFCLRSNALRLKVDGRVPPTNFNLGRRSPPKRNLGRRSPTEQDLGQRFPTEHDLGQKFPAEHNLGQRSPTEHNLGRRSPTEHDLGRRSPTEQTDSMCTRVDYMCTNNDNSYNTLSILEQTDSLKIKFGKYSIDSVLDIENLNESPIMSHEKVIGFLTDSGNDFDVTIHDWEYQKESIYSYIPATPIDKVSMGFYSDADFSPLQTSDQFADANGDCTFDTTTDVPEDEHRPPLPVRNPTRPQCEASVFTPPPLPERPPVNPHPLPPRVTRPPHSLPLQTDDTVPNNIMRKHSPREKRERRLASTSHHHIKNNLCQYPWYHGKLSPRTGKSILAEEEHGCFLLRDSNECSDHHKYTIEFRDGNDFKKLMIMKSGDKYHFSDFKDKTFDSVVHLVETIIKSGLEVKDSDTNTWRTIKVKPIPVERHT